ncbi:hypothetical protein ACH5RR_014366 [Cinchona calisaya]|uniref:Prolyl 4-hydroxylase 7 n=1 Tax=Cinchona calisaya TaxID=153742 RepID=A0ABD3A430_9GENT
MDSRVIVFMLCMLWIVSDLPVSAGKKTKGLVASSAPIDPTRVTQISWMPRAFLYRGFLTIEECDHLITLAKTKLEKSMVADNESGKSIESEVRTSSGMFLRKHQELFVSRKEEKKKTLG